MNGVEIGELLGLLITQVKDSSMAKKVLITADDEDIYVETYASVPFKIEDGECIIDAKSAASIDGCTVNEFIFELQRHKSTKEIIFNICNCDGTYRLRTSVPKFSNVQLKDYEDRNCINIIISVNKI